MSQINTPLAFNVRRCAPELIVPAKPTPRELKPLSDIDDQEGFGRLKEGPARKLSVDCTGEGVLFIEAEADVTLKQFGQTLQPPFPCMKELLYDVPGSSDVVGSPLLLVQVTRLLCGGFIFALRLNHTMCDAQGLAQFLTALSEMAQGASTPSTMPIWKREFLCARDPPRVTCTHHEYDEAVHNTNDDTLTTSDDMTHRSFFFGPTEVSALRRFVPVHLKRCTTFEVLTACLWRCRTIALEPNPEMEMRMMCIVNARRKFNPPFPNGYYGNVFGYPAEVSTARDICNKPFGHALELVMKAKNYVNEEYMRSVADLMVIKGRPNFIIVGSYIVSDLTRAGLTDVDFGWGKALYAGPSSGGIGDLPSTASFYIPYTNNIRESGIVVPICLPNVAMKKFVKELDNMLTLDENNQDNKKHEPRLALSRL